MAVYLIYIDEKLLKIEFNQNPISNSNSDAIDSPKNPA
jgi:hypothetical protein